DGVLNKEIKSMLLVCLRAAQVRLRPAQVRQCVAQVMLRPAQFRKRK
ncbi:hypothetical protein A2U01_0068019, partial [Trifolium medium]|nr:hypothetical protein [Trifolium medium]